MRAILMLICGLLVLSCTNNGNDLNPDYRICTEEVRFGLSITIKDAATGQVLKNGVSVVATDHAYVETLQTTEYSDAFFGAGERSGTYTIAVSKVGYDTKTMVVDVSRDYCHVITESRVVLLASE